MSRPRARPRFTLELPMAPDEVTARVRNELARDGVRVRGRIGQRTIMLTVREEDAHFWSPHLDVQLHETEDGTLLAAMFAPAPQIWTAFLALQLAFGMLSFGAATWVMSAWLAGESARNAVIVLALMLFGGGFSYGAAYVGQGLGSDQMYQLRAFLTDVLRSDRPTTAAA